MGSLYGYFPASNLQEEKLLQNSKTLRHEHFVNWARTFHEFGPWAFRVQDNDAILSSTLIEVKHQFAIFFCRCYFQVYSNFPSSPTDMDLKKEGKWDPVCIRGE